MATPSHQPGLGPFLSLRGKNILETLRTADRASIISLVAANLVPILFAVIFRWDVFGVVLFYWFENLIIGFFAIFRMALAQQPWVHKSHNVKLFLIPFFCVHYSIFCFGHGVFIFALAGFAKHRFDFHAGPGVFPFEAIWSLLPQGVLLPLIALFVSHLVSFKRNYIDRGERLRTNVTFEMFRPYKRIVLLHVCIIFGGMLTFVLGSYLPLVILLMIGKTVLDILMHGWSHEPYQAKDRIS